MGREVISPITLINPKENIEKQRTNLQTLRNLTEVCR